MKLEAFIDDKKVAKVLHALNGLVMQMHIGPVRNAKAKNGKVTEAGEPVSGRDFVLAVIRQTVAAGRTSFKLNEVTDFAGNAVSRTAIYNAIHAMKKAKLLRGKGGGQYLILNKVEKK